MTKTETGNLRNIVLLSHSGAGKTSLSEAMLYETGAINRLGKTDDGTTTSDYEPEEQKRATSIQTSILPCTWNNHKINLIDTPGYADYRGEVISSIKVAESALIIIDASSGVEVGTRQMWKMVEEQSLPKMIFVNKMDRENVTFQAAMDNIVNEFGRSCVALQIPVGSESSFSNTISLLEDTPSIPDNLQELYKEEKNKLVESIAETNDELTMKYLEGEELTSNEMTQGLKEGVGSGSIVPVIFGSATSEIGAKELMTFITETMPSPSEGSPITATDPSNNEDVNLQTDPSGPLAVQVFKTSADPFVGKLSYIKVISGTFKSDQQLWNATRKESERVGQIYVMLAKEQQAVEELAPGDIGAVAKMASVLTGDTLTEKTKPLILPSFSFPEPVFQMATYPKTKADVDKITTAISRITEEDSSLKADRHPETGELLLGGLGDVHIEVAVEKMQRKFGVELELRTPKVPYKETITTQAKVEYRHKKQSGGHGQFGHVVLDVEPLSSGSGFEFAETVVGGSVPREYIPSVEKGCKQALVGGSLAGYPVVDLKATLFDGSFHPVDSSGVSFEIAGSHALSDGIKKAGPIILEPIMHLEVLIPDTDAGDVMGDLNGKRAKILGMVPQGDGTTIVEAEAPQIEVLRYATDLRSQTQGRGSFQVRFDHYEPVPMHLMEKVVQQKQQDESDSEAD
tara:strand:- start:621 stop:2678 length:2058 start_codon:yes stop_codon:yes gene_type:complete